MKRFKRYLLLSVCFLLLSVDCSSIVKANETIIENYQIGIRNNYTYHGSSDTTYEGSSIVIYPNNTTQETTSTNSTLTHGGLPATMRAYWVITHTRGYNLLQGEKNAVLKLSNCYYNVGVTNYSGNTALSSTYLEPSTLTCLVYYTDNTSQYIDVKEWGVSGRILNIELDFTPEKDVSKIEFIITSEFEGSNRNWRYFDNIGEFVSDSSFLLTVETQSEESGFLSGILDWIKGIFNKIVEMAETIRHLPFTIAETISTAIQDLFIPSDAYFDEYSETMSDLLERKFGAVYEVAVMMTESWDRIQANDVTNVIDFPEVTIPLPDNNEFTFGGQQVQIIPDGFEVLVNALKLLVGMVCTVLFINGLKKRYDEIMGGH